MEIGDGEQVPYAACIIMEIYKNDDETYDVEVNSLILIENQLNNHLNLQLYYRKNQELIPKTVTGCEFQCNIDKFIDLLKNNTVNSVKSAKVQCKVAAVLDDIKKNEKLNQETSNNKEGNTVQDP